MIRLGFHGGAGTVTGSKHHLSVDGEELLIDCGMFQGLKDLRERNWKEPPFDARRLRWLLLTHAHLDHTGWLPRLVKHGFRGPILCTEGTRDVARIILMDSAHLQQEEAQYRNEKGITSHAPALPLYVQEDVEAAMAQFQTVEYEAWTRLSDRVSFRIIDVGHILGSGAIEFRLQDGARQVRLVASGDVGRYDMPLHPDPEDAPECDVLLMESTYGDRPHVPDKPEDQIFRVAQMILESRGILLIPAFAVGRSQQVIFIFHRLFDTGRLARIPMYLDTPMGIDATKIYCHYADRYRFNEEALRNGVCTLFGDGLKVVKTSAESMKLAQLKGPAVVISSNGMLTGGRILHHLRNFLPDPKNVLALVGYQAVGSRGRYLQEGAKTCRIFRDEIPVRARVEDLKGFSGHADAAELLRWTQHIHPKRCYLVHGEPESANTLAQRIRQERGWDTAVAKLDQVVEL